MPSESQRSQSDSNISILALLTLPAVAAFAGCGERPEPVAAALSDVVASPEKYAGEFLRVRGFAREGKPAEHFDAIPIRQVTGPNAYVTILPMTTLSVEHRLFVSPQQQEPPLYLRDFETSTFMSGKRDFNEKHSGIDLREISVTGRLIATDSPSGYALIVHEFFK